MKKRIIGFMCIAVLVLGVTGCGGKETGDAQPASTEAVADTAADTEEVAVEELSNSDQKTLASIIAKESELDSYMYEVRTEMMEGMNSTVKVYKSTPWMRMESTVEGMGTTVTLMNMDEGKIYSIDSAQKQIMTFEDPEMFMDPMDSLDMMLEEGMVPEGTELEKTEYKGTKALLLSYEMQDPETGGTLGSNVWYDAEKGVPLAYEIKLGEEVVLTEFIYDFSKVDDAMFELPSDYTMVDVNSMFEDMNIEGMDLEGMNPEDLQN